MLSQKNDSTFVLNKLDILFARALGISRQTIDNTVLSQTEFIGCYDAERQSLKIEVEESPLG